VYAGHAAIALALKTRDPRVPIVPLTLACFGPDWLEVVLMFPIKRAGMAVYTHSIPAVVIGATLAALVYAAFRRPGAQMIFLGWLLHWPADLFTGLKPLFFPTPLIGLDLYKLPVMDFALESVVIIIGCAIYARRFAERGAVRRVVVAMGAALILLQGAVDGSLAIMRNSEWAPSLALARWQPQLVCYQTAARARSACNLQPFTRTHTARESWRRAAHGA
jgi:hypothetical protein